MYVSVKCEMRKYKTEKKRGREKVREQKKIATSTRAREREVGWGRRKEPRQGKLHLARRFIGIH